nr:hypothetical protein [Tanacetum cinerariifolium]
MLYSLWHKAIFFPPYKPSRSETCVSASVKEIDYVQLRIDNIAEQKLQPRAFFSFCTVAYTKDKLVLPLSILPAYCVIISMPKRSTSSIFRFLSVSFSPSAGEAVALSAEGTPMVIFHQTFFSSSLTPETMIGSSIKESGVRKADLVSFKIYAKSSSFTFREMSSARDSLFALEVVWVVFNPSLADLVLSTRTLILDPAGADIPRLDLAVKSAKASCPDADSKCKKKEADQADVGPPVAFCASLCISPTIGVGGEGWLGLVIFTGEPLLSEKSIWELWSPQAHLDSRLPSCG